MRVGVDVRALQFGGAQRGTGHYILNLLDGLASLDVDLRLVLFHFAEAPLPETLAPLLSRVELAAVRGPTTIHERLPWHQRHRLPSLIPGLADAHWASYYRRQAAVFADAVSREKLDLMHLTSPFDPNVPPATACPGRTAYTFLDAIPLVLADRFYDRWPVPARRLYDLQKAAFQTATRVVAISESSRNDAVRLYGLSPDRIDSVFPALGPGFLGDWNTERTNKAREKHGLRERYFAYCSVAAVHKGIDTLIAALAQARERAAYPYQLVVIGNQSAEQRQLVQDLRVKAGLEEGDIVVTGFIPDEEMVALFKGSVALVSPSRYEGFGYPAAQALALGVPVIASNRASLPEVVGDAGILVDPDRPEQIAEAMARIAVDDAFREDLIARGLERSKLFDGNKLAQEMWAFYRSVIDYD